MSATNIYRPQEEYARRHPRRQRTPPLVFDERRDEEQREFRRQNPISRFHGERRKEQLQQREARRRQMQSENDKEKERRRKIEKIATIRRVAAIRREKQITFQKLKQKREAMGETQHDIQHKPHFKNRSSPRSPPIFIDISESETAVVPYQPSTWNQSNIKVETSNDPMVPVQPSTRNRPIKVETSNDPTPEEKKNQPDQKEVSDTVSTVDYLDPKKPYNSTSDHEKRLEQEQDLHVRREQERAHEQHLEREQQREEDQHTAVKISNSLQAKKMPTAITPWRKNTPHSTSEHVTSQFKATKVGLTLMTHCKFFSVWMAKVITNMRKEEIAINNLCLSETAFELGCEIGHPRVRSIAVQVRALLNQNLPPKPLNLSRGLPDDVTPTDFIAFGDLLQDLNNKFASIISLSPMMADASLYEAFEYLAS